jgi:hypothetical protein
VEKNAMPVGSRNLNRSWFDPIFIPMYEHLIQNTLKNRKEENQIINYKVLMIPRENLSRVFI